MDPKLMQRMRSHITKNEDKLEIPYKDSKGLLTIGVGFLVKDEKSFVALPLVIEDSKTGTVRLATDVEKKAEFKRANGLTKTQLTTTHIGQLHLPKEEIERRLDEEIITRMARVRKEIGDADWNKLTDGQKTVLVDVEFATGDFAKFSKLKQAIRNGDVEGMAEESIFHSGEDKETGEHVRNFDRLRRNWALMKGIDVESAEAYREMAERFRDHSRLPPNYKAKLGPSVPKQEPRQKDRTGGLDQPLQDSQEVQLANMQEQKGIKIPADPKVATMIEMASTPIEHSGRSALLKPVEKLTQSEMMDMIHSAQSDYGGWRSGDPLKAHSYEKVQDWHLSMYGDGPQATDGGKPIEPQPIRPIPGQPSPHTTPDGEDLWKATARIGHKLAEAASVDGADQAVMGLQRGLNMLNQSLPLPKRSPAYGPYTGLGHVDEDGKYGPQTDFMLKHAAARLGPEKIEKGLALGRFSSFARDAQQRGNADGLEHKTHTIFGPAFKGGELQETLNTLGSRNHDDWEPLKVDNWIGPKTTKAFQTVLKKEGADHLAQSLGRNLGFL